MNEEKLNISVRKFLKNVGITSQRKIEDKVRENVETSKITKSKNIKFLLNYFLKTLILMKKLKEKLK